MTKAKSSSAYRILHTADWHLGKSLNDQSREEEQKLFLDWLLETVRVEQVDAIVVAGDVFDAANPSQSAEALYFNFIGRLQGNPKTQLVLVAGNHDSALRLEAPRPALRLLRTHIAGMLDERVEMRLLALPSEDQPKVVIALVPFLRERDLRLAEAVGSEREARAKLREGVANVYAETAEAAAKSSCPVIATGHLTVAGAATSESERDIHIGGLDAVDSSIFPARFAYVALGHLHRPQAPDKQGRVRYSGSPIPLSFSEVTDKKEVRILDVEGGAIKDFGLPVPTFRRLMRISGRVEELPRLIREAAGEPAAQLPTWVEVEVKGLVGDRDIAERVHAMAEGLPIHVIKVVLGDVPRLIGPGAGENETDAVLEDLLDRPKDVFDRLLAQQENIPDAQQKSLRLAFAQLLERAQTND